MDKRLPLALFLSFLVLLVYEAKFAPKTKPKPGTPQTTQVAQGEPQPAESQPSGEAGAQETEPAAKPAEPKPEQPAVGPVVGDQEERTLELSIGTPGQAGSYYARFTNRGARLLELRLGDYYDQVGLDAAEKADREHWVTLLESVRSQYGPTGSIGLHAVNSAQPYVRAPLDDALWTMREVKPQDDPQGRAGVVFELAQGSGVRFEKRVLFEPGSYHVDVELALENTGADGADKVLSLFLTPADVVPQEAGDKYYVEPQAVYAGQTAKSYEDGELPRFARKMRDDKGTVQKGQFDVPSEVTRFAGVHNKYFAVLMRAADDHALGTLKGAEWHRVRDLDWAEAHPDQANRAWRYIDTDVLLELRLPAPGETRTWDYVLFAGPKDRELLAQDDPAHEVLVDKDLGFFSTIARVLLLILGLFKGLTGNWGVAIILLTLTVRVLLFPVNRRSQTAMARYSAKMKRLQPQIDELKKRFEKDPSKLRQAQAELMQKEGAFPPLGGCLPMFVQLPIFFGLYSALRTSFDLRHAPFFWWIKDLSQPDRLLRLDLPVTLPLIGKIEYLNILPPLMVVLWVAQQMTMPKPADEQAAKMQRMMMFMPVVMGIFLYNYAAGLSLYMITQSSLGIFEQHVIKRMWPVDESAPVKKRSGFMTRLMQRAQEAQRQAEARNRRASGGKGGRGGKGAKGGKGPGRR